MLIRQGQQLPLMQRALRVTGRMTAEWFAGRGRARIDLRWLCSGIRSPSGNWLPLCRDVPVQRLRPAANPVRLSADHIHLQTVRHVICHLV